MPVDNVVFNKVPEGFNAAVAGNGGLTVTVIGLPQEIETLTADDITVTVDASQFDAERGHAERRQTLL